MRAYLQVRPQIATFSPGWAVNGMWSRTSLEEPLIDTNQQLAPRGSYENYRRGITYFRFIQHFTTVFFQIPMLMVLVSATPMSSAEPLLSRTTPI
ncbi:hypothetical protein N7468_001652 [Penicillium chermesinum]|uniref:Uncharacterized protein n=1 Tax=Penicillium chermesinum TaxID=63820 RepID=A0A9W9TYV0_9EURO|nr:uncharacterized protein N7468_001652 [Penicillium chermesinum]KAJ5246669.1 hypothetical protein N7468_001652 [Penicillium chermesinum]